MSTLAFINGLAAKGVRLFVEGEKLKFEAPSGILVGDTLEELKSRKQDIITLLTSYAGKTGRYPLSYSQRSLWSLHELNPQSCAYNVTYAARLRDVVDHERLQRCLDYLVARHPVLRTTYEVCDGEAVQRVNGDLSTAIEIDDADGLSAAEVRDWVDRHANKPFDLSRVPLRMRILRNETQAGREETLLLAVHHIAADFWSLEILLSELSDIYARSEAGESMRLDPVAKGYHDHVEGESALLRSEKGEALARYWQEAASPLPPALDLPTDLTRPAMKSEAGRIFVHPFTHELTEELKARAKAAGTTPYTFMFTLYRAFLHALAGQSDLAIGVPTAGRNEPGFENVVGHFVNTSVLFSRIDPTVAFDDFLKTSRIEIIDLLEHQDFPFPAFVDRLAPKRDTSRSPVFGAMFNWNQARRQTRKSLGEKEALTGEIVAASSTGTRGATHELTLNVYDHPDRFEMVWTYNTDLFREGTIKRWAQAFEEMVGRILAEPGIALADLFPANEHLPDARAGDPGFAEKAAAFLRAGEIRQLTACGVDDPVLTGRLAAIADAAGIGFTERERAGEDDLCAAAVIAMPAGLYSRFAQGRGEEGAVFWLLSEDTEPAAAALWGQGARGDILLPADALRDGVFAAFSRGTGGWRLDASSRGSHLVCDDRLGTNPEGGSASFLSVIGRRGKRDTGLTVLSTAGSQRLCGDRRRRILHHGTPVGPSEIERSLMDVRGVSDAAVFGVGEDEARKIVAGVATHPGAGCSAEGLRLALLREWPEIAVPSRIVITGELERDDAGRFIGKEEILRLAEDAERSEEDAPTSAVERQLLSIWKETLGTEDLSADDDFFAAGGDSILAAVIIAQAAASGLYLAPKDIFENPSVRALARAVRFEPAIEIDQSPAIGPTPLGPACRWFEETIPAGRAHFNQALLLRIAEAPDLPLLAEAFGHVIEHHDMLRARILEADGKLSAEVPAASGASPAVLHVKAQPGSQAWNEAIEEAQAGLDLESGKLTALVFLDSGKTETSRLLAVVHHLVVDGMSWQPILDDLQTVYLSLLRGRAVSLPPRTSAYRDWVQALRRKVDDGTFAQSSEESSLEGAALASLVKAPGTEAGTHVRVMDVDPALAAKIEGPANETYSTETQHLLLAAAALALCEWDGAEAALIDVESQGRDGFGDAIDLSRSVGWFTAIVPYRLAKEDDPGLAVMEAKEKLRLEPFSGVARSAADWLAPAVRRERAPVLFNYLGEVERLVPAKGLLTGGVTLAPHCRAGVQARTHVLAINAYKEEGRLKIALDHDGAVVSEDAALRLSAILADKLAEIVDHCLAPGAGRLTPSDVPDIEISQPALDEIAREVAGFPAMQSI